MNRNLLLILLPVLLILSSPALAAANGSSPPSPPTIPAAPTGIGCYHYSNSDQAWQSASCETGSTGPGPLVPTEGGSSNSIYGVADASKVNSAWEEVYVEDMNTESDSIWGSNAYSVQLNTNTYTGTNGDSFWSQFTIQNYPNTVVYGGNTYNPLYRLCIWQIDLSANSGNGNYAYDCTPLSSQPLFAGYYAYLNASDTSGTITLTAQIWSGSTWNDYSISESDLIALASHWYDASGTVVGASGGSEAEFTSYAFVDANIAVARSTSASAGNWADLTAESNNLAYTGTSYQGCTGSPGWCEEQTSSDT